jgi:hypothetical protein
MVSSGDTYTLLFLETNYVPDLAGWGEDVDAQLRLAHRQWLGELRTLHDQRARTDTLGPYPGSWRSWSRRPRPRA